MGSVATCHDSRQQQRHKRPGIERWEHHDLPGQPGGPGRHWTDQELRPDTQGAHPSAYAPVRTVRCSPHSTGTASINTVSVTPAGSRPSMIA